MLNSAPTNQDSFISLPIWQSLSQAVANVYQPQRVVIISDNQHHRLSPSIGYGIECWPGQAVSLACGVITANPALKVVVMTTADRLYTADLPQLTEAMRLNHNLTIIASNSLDHDTESSNRNPIALALAADATFIARGFAGDPMQLQSLITIATKHDGLSLIDILQPQHLPNQQHTYAWYRQHIHNLQAKINSPWPTKDRQQAYQLALSWENGIATGLIYQRRTASYQTQLLKRLSIPLVDQPLKNSAIKSLIAKLK